VLEARAEGGRFETLFDFLDRIDTRALNKRACEALIAAGALDAFGHRAQLVAGLDIAYADVNARQADREAGQESLFGGLEEVDDPAPELPAVPEWPERKRLAQEKEALGFFISGHPLDRFSDAVHVFREVNTSRLRRHANASVEIPCVVTQVQRQISRRDSSEWGRITIEDFHGTAQVLAFRDAWAAGKEPLQQDAAVLIRGKVSGRERDEEDPPIFLDEVELLDDVLTSGRLALRIALDGEAEVPEDAFARAQKMLAGHPGDAPVEVLWRSGGGERDRRLRSRTLRVDPGAATLRALREVLGQTRVELVRA
jgi:DNA polymerase-3 subunit alpha